MNKKRFYPDYIYSKNKTTSRTLFIFLMLLLSVHTMRSQQPDGIIWFDIGKATLDRTSTAKLKDLTEKIKKDKSPRITISGFTDENGSTESNLALSKERASAVSDYFTANGVEKDKITVQFFGEEKPVVPSGNDLRENRRVEITLGANKNSGANKKIVEKPYTGIYGKVWKKPVKHIFTETRVVSNEEILLQGPGGTTIRIPPHSLVRPNGEPVKGDIQIELTEYYKKSEMLLANLQTASDSMMLETGGMIHVVARYGNEELSLKPGMEMKIEFAVPKTEKDMSVFIGKHSGSRINWKPGFGKWITIPKYKSGSENSNKDDDDGSVKKMSKIQNLILSSGSLGWINCDRFRTIENKTTLSVEIDPKFNAVAQLVFKDINAIMPGYKNADGGSDLINIPVGQKATIVVFGMVKETPYFISKDIVIADNQVEKLIPKATSFEALPGLLKKVD